MSGELRMPSVRFRQEREAGWRTLEALVGRHQAFLGRLKERGFVPVPVLTGFAVVGYRRGTEVPARLQSRFAFLHRFFVNKWYFDEAIDFLFVRPTAWLGRFCASTVERVFVNGALVGGGTGLVRALSAAVRGLQSGFLRYYAALLLVGLSALGAYFLISA